MQSWRLKKLVVAALEDLKGRDISVLDVRPLTDITDTIIVCTGTSNRHVKSLADNVVKSAKEKDIPLIGLEGEQDAEWILVDLGDIVVNVMQQRSRDFYNLDELWSPKPKKRMKKKK